MAIASHHADIKDQMFTLFGEADIDNHADRMLATASIIGESVASSNDLTTPQLHTLVNTLRQWKAVGKLGDKVTEILNTASLAEAAEEQDAADQGITK